MLGGPDFRDGRGVPEEAAEIGRQLHSEITEADCSKDVGERIPTGCAFGLKIYRYPVVCLNKLLDV